MAELPLETLTRSQVAERLGVSVRTVARDTKILGRACRLHSLAEISRLGVDARRSATTRLTPEEREAESCRLMQRGLRLMAAAGVA